MAWLKGVDCDKRRVICDWYFKSALRHHDAERWKRWSVDHLSLKLAIAFSSPLTITDTWWAPG